MPVVRVETTIKGSLFNAQLWLEGHEINLSHDSQETWVSSNTIEVQDGILEALCRTEGPTTTSWTLEINELEPVAGELFKGEYKIKSSGHSTVPIAVKVK